MANGDPSSALRALEGELFALLARRQAAAAALIQAAPLDAFAHERDTLDAARSFAATNGLDVDLAARVAADLVRADAAMLGAPPRVEPLGEECATPAAAGASTATVIGGAGRMGAWTARFLCGRGYSVTVADPAGPLAGCAHVDNWRDALDADLVVVAAPLRASADILHALAAAPPRGLVFDIGSLKSPLRTGLQALRDAGARVTSVHPMFGPDVKLLSGRHVILVDVGDSVSTDEADRLFASTAATRVRMSLETHDRVIAYVLGLSHALNIAFVTAVAESGEAAPRLAELSSTTFEAQLDVARRVVRENPRLYFEIQHLNDYGVEALSALSYAVEKVRSVVRAGDEEGFVRLMAQGRGYVDGRSSG